MARMTFMTKTGDSNILLRNSRGPRKHLSSFLKRTRGKPSRQKNSKPTSQIQTEQFHFHLFYRLAFYLRFHRREGSVVISKSLKEQNDMYNPEGPTYIADYARDIFNAQSEWQN